MTGTVQVRPVEIILRCTVCETRGTFTEPTIGDVSVAAAAWGDQHLAPRIEAVRLTGTGPYGRPVNAWWRHRG